MKRIIFLFFITIICLNLSSCNKIEQCDCTGKEKEVEEQVNYYVKYDVSLTPDTQIEKATYNVSTERGNVEITGSSLQWSETFGPVGKGFEASLSAVIKVIKRGNPQVVMNIYVCRGQEPFVLKAQKERSFATTTIVNDNVSYTIDF